MLSHYTFLAGVKFGYKDNRIMPFIYIIIPGQAVYAEKTKCSCFTGSHRTDNWHSYTKH